MDIERAVEDFVHKGKDLFDRLRSEGESLSTLGLDILQTQLHVLTVEATRLNRQKRITKTTKATEKQSRVPLTTCAHGRAIDNYTDEKGKRTERFYCLECGAVIDEPPVSQ
jgi:hypothetical protein